MNFFMMNNECNKEISLKYFIIPEKVLKSSDDENILNSTLTILYKKANK
jgi:hypothetical protein